MNSYSATPPTTSASLTWELAEAFRHNVRLNLPGRRSRRHAGINLLDPAGIYGNFGEDPVHPEWSLQLQPDLQFGGTISTN